MNIRISNVDTNLTDNDLRELFAPFGTVEGAQVAMDAFTERPRGFGFVEMPNEEEARAAIEALNGKEVAGRPVTLEPAEPRIDRKGSYKVGDGAVHRMPFRRKR
ncbi:MAG TPA: RNA-binding protein [Chitinophagaceae bacterium]|jgi:RNA recognition motif-containing protein|nr:RNA-binding protein [Chitinophagaceae bacterium]